MTQVITPYFQNILKNLIPYYSRTTHTNKTNKQTKRNKRKKLTKTYKNLQNTLNNNVQTNDA